MRVIIGSKNPIKVEATKEAFQAYYKDIEYLSVDLNNTPGILKQPMTVQETIDSAMKRIKEIEKKVEEADYYVALEGGIGIDNYGSFLTGFVVIKSKDGKESISGGYRMPLPPKIIKELQNDKNIELGDIIDRYSGIKNSKQKDGAIGLFTGGKLNRKEIFRQMIILALVPFTSEVYSKIG